MTVLNPEWLSPCSMERIVCHWTAGTYDISDNDASHYHVILDRYGVAHRGDNPISGNARENPVGPVTSHVKNMNTGSIGIAMAAMGDAIESPFDPGPWPITRIQFLRFAQACAELCAFYEIPVTDTTLLQHGEVQENCGVAQSGKWDVGRLPFAPDKFTQLRRCRRPPALAGERDHGGRLFCPVTAASAAARGHHHDLSAAWREDHRQAGRGRLMAEGQTGRGGALAFPSPGMSRSALGLELSAHWKCVRRVLWFD